MRIYRSTLLAVLIGASSIGSSSSLNAQSFGYPENSKSIFSRWIDQSQKATAKTASSLQTPVPRRQTQVSPAQRPISSEINTGSSNLVSRIHAFDTNKAFSIASPRGSNLPPGHQTAQTSWAKPVIRTQAEQSILEVVEQQPNIDATRPDLKLRRNPVSSGSGPAISTANLGHSRVISQPSVIQNPAALQTQTAPTLKTARPVSIYETQRKTTELSTTQAMLQRQENQNRGLNTDPTGYQRAATAPPLASSGSFENEFNKAYESIGRKRTPPVSGTAPAARVAQRTSINAIGVSHPNSPVTSDSGFDLIPENRDEVGKLQLPPLNEVAPGEFESLEFNEHAPNESLSFSPPDNMVFSVPAKPAATSTLPREADLLSSLQTETSVAPPVAPPVSPGNRNNGIETFALVETSKTWAPPLIPKRPTEHMSTEVPSVLHPAKETVETIDEQVAWWKTRVGQPLHQQNTTQPVDTNGLVLEALRSSPLIKAVSKTPLIRELEVVEADAEFDTVNFLNSQFQDRVDPVGNSLTTGGDPFLEDNIWSAEAGIRKRLRNGGDYSLSQTLGFQNSNSTFFTPQDQGTATLALNVTQPLLRGRGHYVTQAQILIAQSNGSAAWDTFKADLQEELEGMVAAYWDLYLRRSIFLQKKRNVERGQVMLDRLIGRKGLDSLPAQIARAKSAVLTRRTELANCFRDVRNAETEIRRRVSDKNWQASQSIELLPMEMPFAQLNGLELEQVVYTALENRPEIAEAIRRIRIAGVQRDVSSNELLPELNLLLGTYVSSLRADTGIGNAFQDQFGQVTPGYSFGLEYELPYRNRAARSRLQQRNLQFRRLQNELEDVIQNVIAESQVATRQVSSAFATLKAAREAVVASRADLVQNEKRWESFALVEGDIADGQSPTIVLDQLLDSQERLAQAEGIYAEAEQGLKIAEVSLQRIMGTLLMHQQVDFSRSINRDVPSIHINKVNPSNAAHFAPAPPQFAPPQFAPAQFGPHQFTPQENQPQVNHLQVNQPQLVEQQHVQPRVATLNSFVPTPTDEEVALLLQPHTFSQPALNARPAVATQPVTAAKPKARTASKPGRRSSAKKQPSPEPRPANISAEPPLILPAGYQTSGFVPRFDYGGPTK